MRKRNKLVCGVGINDSAYEVAQRGRIICPYYVAWASMLNRCYNIKFHIKNPTYSDCIVVDEWLRFSNFREWMMLQEWRECELDKDILVCGNKVYGPSTCIFVPKHINQMVANSAGVMLGVNWHKQLSMFRAQLNLNGRKKHLGYYVEARDAHAAWQLAKSRYLYDVANAQSSLNIKLALMRHSDRLLLDNIDGRISSF